MLKEFIKNEPKIPEMQLWDFLAHYSNLVRLGFRCPWMPSCSVLPKISKSAILYIQAVACRRVQKEGEFIAMYDVSIYDKSKKLVSTYKDIHTINYANMFMICVSVSGDEILKHHFPTGTDYQLLSDDGNYSIDKSIIGTIEVRRPSG